MATKVEVACWVLSGFTLGMAVGLQLGWHIGRSLYLRAKKEYADGFRFLRDWALDRNMMAEAQFASEIIDVFEGKRKAE